MIKKFWNTLLIWLGFRKATQITFSMPAPLPSPKEKKITIHRASGRHSYFGTFQPMRKWKYRTDFSHTS